MLFDRRSNSSRQVSIATADLLAGLYAPALPLASLSCLHLRLLIPMQGRFRRPSVHIQQRIQRNGHLGDMSYQVCVYEHTFFAACLAACRWALSASPRRQGSQPITGKLILTNDQGWWVVQSLSTFSLPKPQTVSALCVSTEAVGVVSNLPLICRVILHN